MFLEKKIAIVNYCDILKDNFLRAHRSDFYNRCYENTWCYIDIIIAQRYENPLLNKETNEEYVIAFSQALTDLIERNIKEEKEK